MALKVFLVIALCGIACSTRMQDEWDSVDYLKAIRSRPFPRVSDKNEVCYKDIGCFRLDGPMKQTEELPQSPEDIGTAFYAYHAANPHTEEVVKENGGFSHINLSKRLAIVIHGWGNSHTTEELVRIKDALLMHSEGEVATVIMVDWKHGARIPWYNTAASNTQVVGRQIAHLVQQMKTQIHVDPKKIYLIGFSLGAQVAHFAGNFSQSQYHWKFGRITGLDAAGPMFEGYPGAYLTKQDAELVDAIHTSVGHNLLKGEVGFITSYGHVDFFPNGGHNQPMCHSILHPVCNHQASCKFYEASLTARHTCHFKAHLCASYADYEHGKCAKSDTELGYFADKFHATGNQYLSTSAEFPFCNKN